PDRVGSPSIRPPLSQSGGVPPFSGGRPPSNPTAQPPPHIAYQGVPGAPPGIPNALPSPVSSQPDPEAPQISPTTSTDPSVDHHRRKRMYPDQITKAYQGDAPQGASYQGQFITPAGGPGVAAMPAASAPNHFPGTGSVPSTTPYFVPGETSGGFVPGYGAQGQQAPLISQASMGYQGYGAMPPAGVAGVTNQFANMSMGGAPQQLQCSGVDNVLTQISLIGTPPNIFDLDAPPPPIRLPANSPTANCDPRHERCTVNAFPATEALAKKSRIPLALVITPYPTVKDGESWCLDLGFGVWETMHEPVPTVSDTIIARCRRCRTYINPFVTFVEGGQRWKCNTCFLLND
ncbi:hypothetical protein BC938DRAFT_477620, partial [Jimgerdemannia flammicorona]